MSKFFSRIIIVYLIFTTTYAYIIFFWQKIKKHLVMSKKSSTFARFSAFGLPSSAAEGTDDTDFRYGNVDDLVSRLTDVTY